MTKRMEINKVLLVYCFLLFYSCTHAQEVIVENWQNAITELPESKDPTFSRIMVKRSVRQLKTF